MNAIDRVDLRDKIARKYVKMNAKQRLITDVFIHVLQYKNNDENLSIRRVKTEDGTGNKTILYMIEVHE